MSVFTGFLLHFLLSFVAVFVWGFFFFLGGDCCFLREGVGGGNCGGV